MKKEFLISFLIFIPLAAFLSYINYDSAENNLTKSILGGIFGGIAVFFVPYIVRKFNKSQK